MTIVGWIKFNEMVEKNWMKNKWMYRSRRMDVLRIFMRRIITNIG